jgi:type VI secretion system secreted protein VgrG
VLEIIDELLGDYAQSSGLDVAWVWRLQDRAVYRKRSLTQQYRENDLAFLLRLLAEEGLYGWFAHVGGDGDSTGRHTLVIGDHNAAAGCLTQYGSTIQTMLAPARSPQCKASSNTE